MQIIFYDSLDVLITPSGDPKSRILAKFVHSEAFFLSPKKRMFKTFKHPPFVFFSKNERLTYCFIYDIIPIYLRWRSI